MSPLDICSPPGLTERMRRPGNYDYAQMAHVGAVTLTNISRKPLLHPTWEIWEMGVTVDIGVK